MFQKAPDDSDLPSDNLNRTLTFAQVDGESARHIGLAGDTYTIIVAGKDTSDRFCVIDMYVPRWWTRTASSRLRRDLYPSPR